MCVNLLHSLDHNQQAPAPDFVDRFKVALVRSHEERRCSILGPAQSGISPSIRGPEWYGTEYTLVYDDNTECLCWEVRRCVTVRAHVCGVSVAARARRGLVHVSNASSGHICWATNLTTQVDLYKRNPSI